MGGYDMRGITRYRVEGNISGMEIGHIVGGDGGVQHGVSPGSE